MWPPAQGRLGPQKLGGRRPLPWYPHLELRVPASRTGRQPFPLLPTPVWCVVLCRGPHEQKPLCVQNVSGGAGPSRQGTMGLTVRRGDAVWILYLLSIQKLMKSFSILNNV